MPACAATADYKSGMLSFLTPHEKPAGQHKKHGTIKQIFSPPFKFILAVRALMTIRATIRARMTIPRKVKTFVIRAAPTGSRTDTDIIRHVSASPKNREKDPAFFRHPAKHPVSILPVYRRVLDDTRKTESGHNIDASACINYHPGKYIWLPTPAGIRSLTSFNHTPDFPQ